MGGNSNPKLLQSWQAHSGKITSVKHLDKRQSFILTAATDRTVRVWNTNGHYIGVFGQVRK